MELKQRLSAHFVPSPIVPLAEMPLSPAGKVRHLHLLKPPPHREPASVPLILQLALLHDHRLLACLGRLVALNPAGVKDPLFACMQVDRKKLKTDKQFTPNWQSAASAGAEEEYEPPSSPLEEKIQKVWQEVLGQEKISVAADFFQIGGNSLRVG